ncbi:hypothetical protein J3F84DRAFT_147940 [Trichoderma pleuroticola]
MCIYPQSIDVYHLCKRLEHVVFALTHHNVRWMDGREQQCKIVPEFLSVSPQHNQSLSLLPSPSASVLVPLSIRANHHVGDCFSPFITLFWRGFVSARGGTRIAVCIEKGTSYSPAKETRPDLATKVSSDAPCKPHSAREDLNARLCQFSTINRNMHDPAEAPVSLHRMQLVEPSTRELSSGPSRTGTGDIVLDWGRVTNPPSLPP